jgi:hypothetical protein
LRVFIELLESFKIFAEVMVGKRRSKRDVWTDPEMLWTFGRAVTASTGRIWIERESNSASLGITTVEQHLKEKS